MTRLDEVEPGNAEQTQEEQRLAEQFLTERLDSLELPFKFPSLTLVASLCCQGIETAIPTAPQIVKD